MINLPLSINIAFATALVPAIASAKAQNNIETGIKRTSFSILITMLIALPCTVGIFIYAEPILKLLFPNASQGKEILRIMSFSIFFIMLGQTINGALQGFGKIFTPAISLGVGVIVKLLLNIILIQIPSINIYGASIATVACYIIAFLISFSVLIKNIKININWNNFLIKPIIATIIMSFDSIYVFNICNNFLGERKTTIIALCFAVFIYICTIIFLKVLKKEEILMLPQGEKIYKVLVKAGIYKKF